MTDYRSTEIDSSQRKFGPIWLSPGVRPTNVLTLFFAAAMAIAFINVLNLLHPYILGVHLDMPTDVQGDFTGNLYVAVEAITIALAIPVGTLSDRIGRRPVFITGFLLICIGMIPMPLAESREAYAALRVVASAGLACCMPMVSSLIADYPQNASRGKMIGINGVFTAFGIIFVASFGLVQLPKYFADRGVDAITAGTYTYWITAVLVLITALITWAGIKRGRISNTEQREPLLKMFRVGFAEIVKNPRLRFGCGATFMSRGDLTVFATFFSLWIVAVGTDEGIDAAEAQATAGRLFGLAQVAMLLFLPIMGFLVDRLDRVTAVAIGLALAAVGYIALGVAPDPFNSPLIYVVAVLAGIGEGAMIVSVPGLVGQEAPAKVRGSIIGVVALCGGLGIMLNMKLSGLMFDGWSYQAPFLFMAALNGIVLLWAIAVRIRTGNSKAAATLVAAEVPD